MSTFISKTPGEYIIEVNSTLAATFINYNIDQSYGLPKQVLRLKSYRVHTTTPLVTRGLKVVLPFLSYNHNIDSTPNFLGLTVPLSGNVVTLASGDNRPLFMNSDAEKSYNISIYDINNTVVTDLLSMTLIFETEFGSF